MTFRNADGEIESMSQRCSFKFKVDEYTGKNFWKKKSVQWMQLCSEEIIETSVGTGEGDAQLYKII